MFTIYGILVDVMRLGAGPEEQAKQDVQLWIDHQREIEFLFECFLVSTWLCGANQTKMGSTIYRLLTP
jgi:hypothetical protein